MSGVKGQMFFMQPVILHLDMNSYFASVEQQDHPEWRDKPVGVCEHLGGIIIGASVEAKVWGIKTGTPVWEAKKLYPKIILTHTHAERYRHYTRAFLKVAGDYTGRVEKYSIDECFLDLTKVCNIKNLSLSLRARVPPRARQSNIEDKIASSSDKALTPRNDIMSDPFIEAVNIAREIKRRFKTEVGDWLRCSIGIADNKAVAKIASDLKKPDGLVVVIPDVGPAIGRPQSRLGNARPYHTDCLILSRDELYEKLSLTDIPGIGRRQERNLNQLGIKTLKNLRDFPRSHLIARFGAVSGYHLYNLGQLKGSWKADVASDGNIKSMGHMYTLPREFRQPEFFLPVLYKLCEMVGRRLRRKNLEGNIISCYYHDKDYQGFGDSKRLGYFLQDGREIFLAAADIRADLLRGHPRGLGMGQIKLIGITVAGLRFYIHQLSLFGDVERQRRVARALDKINDRYGEFTILRAQMAKAGKVFRDSVGFGRMKEL